jgi:hypothetical protein
MKGKWVFYMLAWLLAVATIAEANAQTGSSPTSQYKSLLIHRLAAPRMWPCGLSPMG